MWFKNSVEIRSQVAPKKYMAFLMINAYKKIKNKKFKKIKLKGSFSWTFANDIDVKNFLNIH